MNKAAQSVPTLTPTVFPTIPSVARYLPLTELRWVGQFKTRAQFRTLLERATHIAGGATIYSCLDLDYISIGVGSSEARARVEQLIEDFSANTVHGLTPIAPLDEANGVGFILPLLRNPDGNNQRSRLFRLEVRAAIVGEFAKELSSTVQFWRCHGAWLHGRTLIFDHSQLFMFPEASLSNLGHFAQLMKDRLVCNPDSDQHSYYIRGGGRAGLISANT